jgi:hypothetical protein
LTVKEVNELLTDLKDKYGIEPAAAALQLPVAAGPAEVVNLLPGKNNLGCYSEITRVEQNFRSLNWLRILQALALKKLKQ